MNYEGNCDREVGGTGPGHSPSEYLGTVMASTLPLSIFLARARRRKRKGESYFGFFLRDLSRSSKKS